MFTKFVPVVLIGTLCGAVANAALTVGATAPDFKAVASLAGKQFNYSLAEARKKGPVVVYFYPSAFTNGCNLQAHTFAVNKDKFDAAGATIIGVSLDRIDTLNEFSADPEYCGGKIAVASDVSGAIAKSFELSVTQTEAGRKDSRGKEIEHGRAERTTFIVDQRGKVVAMIGGVTPIENVNQSLEKVLSLKAPVK